MRRCLSLALLVVGASLAACGPPEKSARGFHLPDGDVSRGREAFVNLKCNACHEVRGLNLAPPVADPPVPVALGGRVTYQPTDGRFVTAIINPDHELARGFPEELITSGGESRMADYGDVITARQLIDLVAFLHSRYEYTPPQQPIH